VHLLRLSAAIVALALLPALASGGCAGGDSGDSRSPDGASAGRIIRVIDGDTLAARRSGTEDRVRLVGIDTPEVEGPYTDAECFGSQASQRMRVLVAPGDTVRLETDPTQDTRDRHGRLLAYAYRLGEARSLNERMVAEGYARVYVVRNRPFLLAGRFQDLEDAARRARRGLWGACTSPALSPPAHPTPNRSRDCPPARPVKGNLPSRIYHRPGDPGYAQTRPERCFATPADAERAGFRPPQG
jgi:micrococcal nuclease